jgi:predicted Zn-dependent protease
MLRTFITLICLLFLTGCAGSAYRLPQVNSADVQAMQKKIAENTTPLKVYERSDKTYEQKLANITNRLKKNAKPLCDYAQYENCYFKTTYSPDNEVNAYASEGYAITLHRGLLQYLKTDDEIAAVVGHEMGHHLANHIQEKQQNAAAGAAVTGILTAVLLGAAGANTYYDPYQQQQNQQTIEDMMTAGAHIGILSYSKEQEREADLLATYLLSRAGYNLKRAQNVMLVLSKHSGEADITKSAFLDSHPDGIERIVAWEMAIEEVKNNPAKLPYSVKEAAPQNTEASPEE